MKRFMVILLMSMAACHHQPNTANIVGVYTLAFTNEFSTANDTISITVYNAKARTYLIERRTGFNRMLDGKVFPREYKVETVMAIYDEDHNQLHDQNRGKIFSFNGQAELSLGTSVYKKIK